jgi:hypothetical protein
MPLNGAFAMAGNLTVIGGEHRIAPLFAGPELSGACCLFFSL